ncbi:hypothetical protein [uncultured Cohaesibacter sp.]|uniref:hypothetical protein n=1 Tax=uncultured Cohaesibacter sp. TaxID=1002546 RepID=UPI0029C73B1D|nr:hypothetical protein [uncultured Cohaesibacter sp.]
MIKLVAGVNLFAAVVHVLFWAAALVHLGGTRPEGPVSSALATTFGIGIADLVWSVPLLLTGSLLLIRRKPIGWLAAQMANGLYFYSMTFILVRDGLVGVFQPGTLVFLPFTLFAVFAFRVLWKERYRFFASDQVSTTLSSF